MSQRIGLFVASKNARLSSLDRLMDIILVELDGISWDVILFTETRRSSTLL